MARSFRFYDFISEVRGKLERPSSRQGYADTLDEWLSEAIKEENWEAAEAFMAGLLLLDPDRFPEKKKR